MTTFFGKKGKILLLPIAGLFVAPNVAAQNPQAPDEAMVVSATHVLPC